MSVCRALRLEERLYAHKTDQCQCEKQNNKCKKMENLLRVLTVQREAVVSKLNRARIALAHSDEKPNANIRNRCFLNVYLNNVKRYGEEYQDIQNKIYGLPLSANQRAEHTEAHFKFALLYDDTGNTLSILIEDATRAAGEAPLQGIVASPAVVHTKPDLDVLLTSDGLSEDNTVPTKTERVAYPTSDEPSEECISSMEPGTLEALAEECRPNEDIDTRPTKENPLVRRVEYDIDADKIVSETNDSNIGSCCILDSTGPFCRDCTVAEDELVTSRITSEQAKNMFVVTSYIPPGKMTSSLKLHNRGRVDESIAAEIFWIRTYGQVEIRTKPQELWRSKLKRTSDRVNEGDRIIVARRPHRAADPKWYYERLNRFRKKEACIMFYPTQLVKGKKRLKHTCQRWKQGTQLCSNHEIKKDHSFEGVIALPAGWPTGETVARIFREEDIMTTAVKEERLQRVL